jgi:hypothetical protein
MDFPTATVDLHRQRPGVSSRQYSYATPDLSRVTPGIEWVGPNSNDAPVDKRLAKDSPHQQSNRDSAAIF